MYSTCSILGTFITPLRSKGHLFSATLSEEAEERTVRKSSLQETTTGFVTKGALRRGGFDNRESLWISANTSKTHPGRWKIEKYARQNGFIFPKFSGCKTSKNSIKPPSRKLDKSHLEPKLTLGRYPGFPNPRNSKEIPKQKLLVKGTWVRSYNDSCNMVGFTCW